MCSEDPQLLVSIANHFYKSQPGTWICLEISSNPEILGSEVKYEAPAPVGNIASNIVSTSEHVQLFPHIYGGIPSSAVLNSFKMSRMPDGSFLDIDVTI
jgi:uncharacterized protein (DUF952 family)